MTTVGTVSSPSERWIWYIFTVTFLVSMTKYLSNKQLKGGGVSFESQFQGAQSITVGKLCQCEQETACQSYSVQTQYAELEQEVALVVKSFPGCLTFYRKAPSPIDSTNFPNSAIIWELSVQTHVYGGHFPFKPQEECILLSPKCNSLV